MGRWTGDYPEDATTEDDTSDIAEGESTGKNMFSDTKSCFKKYEIVH